MIRDEDYWIDVFQRMGAYWEHDGNPRRPHALLASGLHSNGFFNSRLVIEHDELLRDAAADLLELVLDASERAHYVDVFAGPQTGATKLSRFLGDLRDRPHVSPQKTEDGPMLLSREERLLVANKSVLMCEDVITTGGSVKRAADSITDAGGRPLEYVLALVNRSGLTNVDGRVILALVERHLPTWKPEDCPLCKLGLEAIRAKGDNWARLNATY